MNYAYIAQRIALALFTFLIASSAAYFILNVLPGDLAQVILGDFATPAKLVQLREQLGLDRPLFLRYLDWLLALVQGDLGRSAFSGESILELLGRKLQVTIELALLATGLGVLLGLPAGIVSAIRPGTWLDAIVRPLSIMGIAAPSFWIGLLVLLLPSLWWNYAPPTFVSIFSNPVENLQLMLPAAAVIGFAFTASISRVSRTTMLEVMREDYVRTAYAKGLTERTVIMRHALRNAVIPLLTLVSLQFAALLGGTVIVESIFSLPGIGRSALAGIQQRDYPIVQGFVVLSVFVYVTVNLVVDVLASVIDPRIRLR